ncbi:hypothetical protein D3C79_1045040 [compost metagenome]
MQPASTRIAVGEFAAHRIEDIFVGTQGFTDHQRDGIFQRFADLLAARDFTHAGMTGVVFDNDNVTGEERGVCATQVH